MPAASPHSTGKTGLALSSERRKNSSERMSKQNSDGSETSVEASVGVIGMVMMTATATAASATPK